MRPAWAVLTAASALMALSAAAQAPGEDSAVPDLSCDRACLLGALDGYMAALAARDPARAPAAADIRFSENNVLLKLGQGLWGTVTGVDEQGLEASDPLTGNAAWFGSVRENGSQAMFALRIHVKHGLIDEAESVVVRRMALAGPGRPPIEMQHDPAFGEVLPQDERRPRERMVAIADSYFDTVERNDGQVFAPFAEDCARLENGISTTRKDATTSKGNAASYAEGCEAQFKLGIYLINKRVRERRFPIIDTERGVVVAAGFFDHANEFDHYALTDGREMKTGLKWPNSANLLEAFRIRNGEIQRIEAVFTYAPYAIHNPFAGPDSTEPDHAPAPEICGNACLAALTGQVMKAYASKDWPSLPWASKVSYSDENVGLQVGDGIWGTITAIDDKPLIVADAQTGKAVWIGRIEEHGQPAWAAIAVEGAAEEGEPRIGGIETLVHRREYGPPWAEPVHAPSYPPLPPTERMNRADMLAAIAAFRAAINRHDGTAPAGLAEDCRRSVNGQDLSGCAAPLTGNLLQPLAKIRDVRILAVDEERGLVAVSTFEDYPASQQRFTDAAGQAYGDTGGSPRTLKTVELFRFERGKLEHVDAYTLQLPFGMRARPTAPAD